MQRVKGVLFILGCLSLLFGIQFLSATTNTSLEVIASNIPPILTSNIPNQTWAVNTNFTDAFSLDDYFLDNETINYSSTGSQNVSILINETTNIVSFYPDQDFEGIDQVTFIASDWASSTSSNVVYLNVTSDNQAPEPSNPSKDLDTVYQNSVVQFSMDWTDNIALASYFLSIKEQSGWTNLSSASFAGLSNQSTYSVQISSPGNTQVSWVFYALDTSGNINVSEVENFTVLSSPSTPSDDDDDNSSSSTISKSTSTPQSNNPAYSLDPPSGFNIELIQGDTTTIVFKIKNTGNTNISFEIDLEGLEEFTKSISDESFTLGLGESKVITIELTAQEDLLPDIYHGIIKVLSPNTVASEVPVAVIIKEEDVEFDLLVEVSKESKEVRFGEQVYANITLKNLKDVREKEVAFYYALMDFYGNVLDSGFDEFRFASQSVVFSRNLTVPENTNLGEYLFFARAVDKENIVVDSDTFTVGERLTPLAFLEDNIFIFILLIALILIPLAMMKYHKDKERLRLLNLYLMISKMDKLRKQGKMEEAFDIYVRIKAAYGEPVSKTVFDNKEELTKEMVSLTKEVNTKISLQPKQLAKEQSEGGTKETKENNSKDGKNPEKSQAKISSVSYLGEKNKIVLSKNKQVTKKSSPKKDKAASKEKINKKLKKEEKKGE